MGRREIVVVAAWLLAGSAGCEADVESDVRFGAPPGSCATAACGSVPADDPDQDAEDTDGSTGGDASSSSGGSPANGGECPAAAECHFDADCIAGSCVDCACVPDDPGGGDTDGGETDGDATTGAAAGGGYGPCGACEADEVEVGGERGCVCAPTCAAIGQACNDAPSAATCFPTDGFGDDDNLACLMLCEDDSQCAANMICDSAFEGIGVCVHP